MKYAFVSLPISDTSNVLYMYLIQLSVQQVLSHLMKALGPECWGWINLDTWMSLFISVRIMNPSVVEFIVSDTVVN